jgi:hypothetical protein
VGKETLPSEEGHPYRLPAPSREPAYRLRGNPSAGASLDAPTAPHATEPLAKPKVKTGPGRFWDPWRIRIVLILTLTISCAFHWTIAPWRLLPPPSGIEFKDPEGELSIPVDLIGEEAPPPPPDNPPPTPPEPTPTATPPGPNFKDAGPKIVDAGPPPDAEPLATIDASVPVKSDDGGTIALVSDAGGEDGGIVDGGGLVALADGSAGPGPRDPESMFGMKKAVNTGPQNVVLGVNTAVIRKNPVGARMGPVLQQIPQWKDFLKGSQTLVDPVQQTDWILIYGPSLRHTDRCAVLVHYNVSDQAVDQAVDGIAKGYDKGGPYDAGVPGVKASMGYADQAQRVFLRPQSKLLVIVPPAHAKEAAQTYKAQAPRGPAPNEAMRLVVKHPSKQIFIPNLKFQDSLTELRLWIVPRADGGADVHAEGDATDEAGATDSADALNNLIKSQNSIGVRIATRGLLNNANVRAEGKQIRLDLQVSQEQLEAVLNAVAAFLGANVPPPSGGGGGGGGEKH